MYSKLLKMWKLAAKDFDIDIEYPYSVILNNNTTIDALLLVKNVGGDKGMLIINNFNIVKNHIDELIQLGYGFSVLEEPSKNELYNKDEYAELLYEWGWDKI